MLLPALLDIEWADRERRCDGAAPRSARRSPYPRAGRAREPDRALGPRAGAGPRRRRLASLMPNAPEYCLRLLARSDPGRRGGGAAEHPPHRTLAHPLHRAGRAEADRLRERARRQADPGAARSAAARLGARRRRRRLSPNRIRRSALPGRRADGERAPAGHHRGPRAIHLHPRAPPACPPPRASATAG